MASTSLNTLRKYKTENTKFSCLTAYDACFSHIISEAGVEVLLVGDSLGMVLQGNDSTVPVTMEEMCYHTSCVKQGNQGALLMADMPFMSYHSPEQALENAAQLMQAGAQVVKLEGGEWLIETIALLAERGIPTCVHLGLTPQSVNKFGGYKVQGRDEQQAANMLADAKALEEAGADILLLECVPSALATKITQSVSVPVIGIGASSECDGQVLVVHDMLGITPHKPAKFVRNFMIDADSIQDALVAYNKAVKDQSFPSDEHCFS